MCFTDGSCSFRSFSNIPDMNPAANRNGCIALGGAQNSWCQTTRWTLDPPGFDLCGQYFKLNALVYSKSQLRWQFWRFCGQLHLHFHPKLEGSRDLGWSWRGGSRMFQVLRHIGCWDTTLDFEGGLAPTEVPKRTGKS